MRREMNPQKAKAAPGCKAAPALVSFALIFSACAGTVRAQNPDDLMPAQSAAKARSILDDAVAALGGEAYLHVRDTDCKGTYGAFDTVTGESDSAIPARFTRQYPDKSRTEMDSKSFLTDIYGIPINLKGRMVMVYTPEGAWSITKAGVTDMGPDAVNTYKEQLKNDMNTLLRTRLNEDGLILRYGGADLIDLKQVDWVEVTDKDHKTTRIAFDRKTHLPVRSVALSRDAITNIRVETARTYTNYHLIGGIEIPFQSSIIINDHPQSQVFYSSCQANTGVARDLFARPGFDPNAAPGSAKPGGKN